MGIAVSIVSAVLKSVTEDKFGNGLAKELMGISIDGISEKGINEITDFINGEKSKIDSILSKENMKSMGISEDKTDYVVTEIKDLFSKISITDEVLRQCKYDSMYLSVFLWDKYRECKNDYIECESEIKQCLFAVAETLIKLVRESENFEKDVLIHISNSVDDVMIGLQKISEYMKENFGKIDDNSQIVLNVLLMILEQIQQMNMQNSETKSITDEDKKFKNNKKEKYIKIWNSRLFLHLDNKDNPLTLADAFIMPDYKINQSISRIGFSASDTLDQIIEKFIKYDKTSTMLLAGVPGIGKSTITSWMANKYKADDKVIILRFRDWECEELDKGILKSICVSLECKKKDLERKILVLDGFDEMKSLDIRQDLLYQFINDIKDFDNFKCIITSRLSYIEPYYFHVALELRGFDIDKIEKFCEKVMGHRLENKEKIESNLEVLGIPVILYMAIMSNVDISENPTKPELYERMFAEEGGIFDKFYYNGIGYDNGTQILRNIGNINQYLIFLSEIAFRMFEKKTLVLSREECQIPELEIERKKINILEFPIKYFFENSYSNIEFIHRSIYEYFVAEKIIVSIKKALGISEKELASVFGEMFNKEVLSKEIIEFLRYKIQKNGLYEDFFSINNTFKLMLHYGMTYYVKCSCKNIIMCEVRVFANILEIIHLWENELLDFDNTICNYIRCNKDVVLNLDNLNLEKVNLRGIYLKEASLRNTNLKESDLRGLNAKRVNAKGANLIGADLIGADLIGADLIGADLIGAKLNYAKLMEADLRGANLEGAKLQGANLQRVILKNANLEKANLQSANLEGTDLKTVNLRDTDFTESIFDEEQIEYLREKVDLEGYNILVHTSNKLISYKEYSNRNSGNTFTW